MINSWWWLAGRRKHQLQVIVKQNICSATAIVQMWDIYIATHSSCILWEKKGDGLMSIGLKIVNLRQPHILTSGLLEPVWLDLQLGLVSLFVINPSSATVEVDSGFEDRQLTYTLKYTSTVQPQKLWFCVRISLTKKKSLRRIEVVNPCYSFLIFINWLHGGDGSGPWSTQHTWAL